MKTLLACISLALLLSGASAQTPTTRSPFPSGTGKERAISTTNGAGFDLSQLIGKWKGFVSTGDGSNPSQRVANVSLTISADKIVCSSAGSSGEGTHRITSGSGKLHQIDGTGTGDIYRGKVYLGIFTLEGNTLKWCSTEGSRIRPTVLRTNYAAGRYLMILTQKPRVVTTSVVGPSVEIMNTAFDLLCSGAALFPTDEFACSFLDCIAFTVGGR